MSARGDGIHAQGFKRSSNDALRSNNTALLEPEIGCIWVVEVEAGGGDDGFAEKLVTEAVE